MSPPPPSSLPLPHASRRSYDDRRDSSGECPTAGGSVGSIGERDDDMPAVFLCLGTGAHRDEPADTCAGGKHAVARMPNRAAIHVWLFRVPQFGLVKALVWHLHGVRRRNLFCWTASQAVLPAGRGRQQKSDVRGRPLHAGTPGSSHAAASKCCG